jgi:hypothetical protein
MKKINYLFVGVMLILAGCNNFLDTVPQNGDVTDASYWKSTEEFDAFMYGAYIEMAGAFDQTGVGNWIKISCFVSQDATGPDEIRKPLNQYMSATNSQITAFWTNYFKINAKVNTLLSRLKDAPIPEADKTRLEGEALFFRGFAYFHLVRAYGDVPLILEPYTVDQNYLERTPEEQVWKQVISDLSDAAKKLPTRKQWPNDKMGRAAKGAAYAYLTNAYMYTKEWDKAEAAANSLIALKEYDLMPTVRSLWSLQADNNIESIFEVQFRDVADGSVNWSGYEAGGVMPEYTAPRNIGGEWAMAGGWGEIVGTRKLADSFDPNDDRRKELIKIPGEKYKGELMSDTLLIPMDIAQPNSCFSTKYWLGPLEDKTVSYVSGQNNPLMRYAEFLLNYAEILFQNGKSTDAYAQLNRVRNRAKLGSLPVSTDKETFMTDLMKERRAELNFEPNLWFHFTRTGTAAKFLKQEYNVTMNPAWYKFPIPQSERDQNPNLSQNAGY